jgi:hypothetical protein
MGGVCGGVLPFCSGVLPFVLRDHAPRQIQPPPKIRVPSGS